MYTLWGCEKDIEEINICLKYYYYTFLVVRESTRTDSRIGGGKKFGWVKSVEPIE